MNPLNFLIHNKKIACLIFCFIQIHLFGSEGKESISVKDVDVLVEKTMHEWAIPGLALSFIKGDQSFSKGYGRKSLAIEELINEKTIFQLSSLSKMFTAFVISTCVHKQKLEWEKPILTYIPHFCLKDDWATNQITLRDLLSHRTGLPNHAQKHWWRLWWWLDVPQKELIKRLSFVEPAQSFRSHFSYNNMAYVLAAYVAEEMEQQNWKTICQTHLFSVLNLSRTNLDYDCLLKDGNVASAHVWNRQAIVSIPWRNWETMAAAAGLNSCAEDLTKWLNFCLSTDSKILKDSLEDQILIEPQGFLGDIEAYDWPLYIHQQKLATYCYGWMSYVYKNEKVFFHTGLSDGMQSILAIVPSKKIGIAILTNLAPQKGVICLLNQLLEKCFGEPVKDWHQLAKETDSIKYKNTQKSLKTMLLSRIMSSPKCPLKTYSGKYFHPAYGLYEIIYQDNHLFFKASNQQNRYLFEHWQNEQFEIKDPVFIFPWLVEFKYSTDQTLTGFEMPEVGFFKKE